MKRCAVMVLITALLIVACGDNADNPYQYEWITITDPLNGKMFRCHASAPFCYELEEWE